MAGCHSGNASIRGTISFPDGQPLTKGTVVFQSEGHVAKGVLDSSGKYVLGSISSADGLPPGIYKVFITFASVLDEKFVPPANEPDAVQYTSLIADNYASAEKTPLTCEVIRSGIQNFTVEPPSKAYEK
ncbi:hypothetical protein FACS1894214_5230 [Planctomycetales bacterium]|nr:hypothetical protein FACS1894214_5230 [Planctomycetales bacterium]